MKDKLLSNAEEGDVTATEEPETEVPEPSGDQPSGDQDVGKQQQKEDEAVTWLEFTENTTFHGIKYIFDDKPFGCRRALWFVSVMVAVTVFLCAGIARVLDYRGHQVTVNVMVLYDTPLEFPDVTICNQNSHRLTKAVEYKVYNYIDEFYSNETADLSKYGNLTDVNLPEFIFNSAHTFEDFIDDCTWKKHNCTSDFKMVLTDAGICFTFSPPNRMVHLPGSGQGLRLVLNLEQYEYMKGRQDDVGVKNIVGYISAEYCKSGLHSDFTILNLLVTSCLPSAVLLHDNYEKPQIKEQGFVVEPGKHTLVTVQRTDIKTLGEPFDRSSADAMPLPDCQLAFESQALKDRCNCTSIYMSNSTADGNITDPNICKMKEQFECIFKESDQPSQKRRKCPVPLNSVRFEPRLSSALLSKYNIERVALSEPGSREVTKVKFLHARDISQRAIESINKTDSNQMDKALDFAQQLRQKLINFADELKNASALAGSAGVVDVFGMPIREQFTDTKSITGKIFHDRQKYFKDMPNIPDLGILYTMVRNINMYFLKEGILNSLNECVASRHLFPDQYFGMHSTGDDQNNLCRNMRPPDEKPGQHDRARPPPSGSEKNDGQRPDPRDRGGQDPHSGQRGYSHSQQKGESASGHQGGYYKGDKPPPDNQPRAPPHKPPPPMERQVGSHQNRNLDTPTSDVSGFATVSPSFDTLTATVDNQTGFGSAKPYSSDADREFMVKPGYPSIHNPSHSNDQDSIRRVTEGTEEEITNNPTDFTLNEDKQYRDIDWSKLEKRGRESQFLKTVLKRKTENVTSSNYSDPYPSKESIYSYSGSSHLKYFYPTSYASFPPTGTSYTAYSSSYYPSGRTDPTSPYSHYSSVYSNPGSPSSYFSPDSSYTGSPSSYFSTNNSYLESNFSYDSSGSSYLGLPSSYYSSGSSHPDSFSSYYSFVSSDPASASYNSSGSSYPEYFFSYNSSGSYYYDPSAENPSEMYNTTDNQEYTTTPTFATTYNNLDSTYDSSENFTIDNTTDPTQESFYTTKATCAPVETSLPAIEELTKAAINPACITVYTSTASFTLAQYTSGSLIYYNVNSMSNVENGPGSYRPSRPFYTQLPPLTRDDPHGGGGGGGGGDNDPDAQNRDDWFKNMGSQQTTAMPINTMTYPPEYSDQCDQAIYIACFKGDKREHRPNADVILQDLASLRKWYINKINETFEGQTNRYKDNTLHKQCLVELDELEDVVPSLKLIIDSVYQVLKAHTVQNLIDALEQFESPNLVATIAANMGKVDLEYCMWFKKYWMDYGNTKSKAEMDVKQYIKYVEQSSMVLLSLSTEITFLGSSLTKLKTSLDSGIQPNLDKFIEYRNGSYQKASLVEKYDSLQVKTAFTNMQTTLDEFKGKVRSVEGNLGNVRHGMMTWYRSLLKTMIVPLVNTSTINSLPVINSTNKFVSLANTTEAYLIPDKVILPMENIMKNASQVINKLFSELQSAEADIRQNLAAYARGNIMDTAFFMENFLQVDIYYTDISLHTITSQEAFTWVSLLSEIGGFMGLLLGASVLTVCEVLDFILLQCVNVWGSNDRKYKKK